MLRYIHVLIETKTISLIWFVHYRQCYVLFEPICTTSSLLPFSTKSRYKFGKS